MDTAFLDELLLHISSLSSIYHKSPTTFIHRYKPRFLIPSPALRRPQSSQTFAPAVTPQQQQQPKQTQTQPLVGGAPLLNDLGYNSLAANRYYDANPLCEKKGCWLTPGL